MALLVSFHGLWHTSGHAAGCICVLPALDLRPPLYLQAPGTAPSVVQPVAPGAPYDRPENARSALSQGVTFTQVLWSTGSTMQRGPRRSAGAHGRRKYHQDCSPPSILASFRSINSAAVLLRCASRAERVGKTSQSSEPSKHNRKGVRSCFWLALPHLKSASTTPEMPVSFSILRSFSAVTGAQRSPFGCRTYAGQWLA